jgi:hypothetical protein
MKRWFFILALCSLPVAAFAQDTPTETPAIAPGPATAPAAKLIGAFDWKLRLQPGQKWQIRTFTRMTQSQEFAPPTPIVLEEGVNETTPKAPEPKLPSSKLPPRIEIQSMQRLTLDYEVLAIDKFGASTVRLSYRELLSDTTSSSEGKPYPDEKTAHQNFAVKDLEGASLTVKQAADGTVWNVSGFEALPARILKALPNLTTEQKLQAQQFAGQFSSDKYWRRFFQSLSGFLPKFPVMVSESWNYEVATPADLPIQLTYQGKRTLNARKDGIAFIQEQANIDSGSFDIKGGEGSDNVAIRDYKGAITGASQIEEKTGMPLSSNMSYKISGLIEVEGAAKTADFQKLNASFTVTGETHTVLERKN